MKGVDRMRFRWRAWLESNPWIRNLMFLLPVAIISLSVPLACGDDVGEPQVEIVGGSTDQGVQQIERYGCGSCHTIPGIDSAEGTVGPPLSFWADRGYIAGSLPNTPENLIHWIQNPQDVEPGTAMPDLGVSEAEARHIATYLYTLTKD